MKAQVTFLGTASQAPSLTRNVSATAVRLPRSGPSRVALLAAWMYRCTSMLCSRGEEGAGARGYQGHVPSATAYSQLPRRLRMQR